MAPTSYYGMQWTDTSDGFTCSGAKFLNNTYAPNAPDAWLRNTPARFECNLAPGGIPTEVAGNTFQEAPQSPPGAVAYATEPIPFAVREPAVDLDAVERLGWGVAVWLRAGTM